MGYERIRDDWKAGDPHRIQGEGAESFAEFLARICVVRGQLKNSKAKSVIVFSHKKFINALLWLWLGLIRTVHLDGIQA